MLRIWAPKMDGVGMEVLVHDREAAETRPVSGRRRDGKRMPTRLADRVVYIS